MTITKPAYMTLSGWEFKACKDEHWLPAAVPGCVHTDLLRNGKIEDPFYGTNEKRLQWIDKEDWEYRTSFAASPEQLSRANVELVFDGLDTYADVTLNGQPILSADNMFRSWRADVKELLQEENTLRVRFRSPIQEDLPKLRALGYALPAANDQSEAGGLGDEKVSVFARKAPYHYGWDWGPRFVTSGIWKDVRLESWSGIRIRDFHIRQDQVTAEAARLTALVEVETDEAWSGELRVSAEGRQWSRDVRLEAGSHTVQLAAELESPRLWWSRGLGAQELTDFRAELVSGGDVHAQETVTTGLRSAKLVRQKDAHGTSFYIELNGVPVFCKGANHIPNDSFVTEVTYERYRHEVASAAEANMNMLRVWGGGIYEHDDFYRLCDEYGILVWQDFMFACSMYPGDEAFLASVRSEAEENVKRLRRHPSVVLWCGNNEMDTAWSHYDENAGWGWKKKYSPELREKIWRDYEAIFHEILPETIRALSPETDYWPSSPMREVTGDANQHATSSSPDGDIHYWGVWHNVEPFSNYKVHIGRFMSEYGFQSFPEEKTVETYAAEEDMALVSEVMLSHQKNGRGNMLIKEYMDQYLSEPKDFRSFLYMSQVLQGEAMKTAIEAHRRRMGFTMGSLYWQMNDCWPVASWAGMDYLGRWKALQYYAKRSFRDVMLSLDENDGKVEIHGVSDLQVPLTGTLELRLLDFQGNVLRQWPASVTLAANAAGHLKSLAREEVLEGADPASVVLTARFEGSEGTTDLKEHYFLPVKDLRLEEPGVRITRRTEGEQVLFTLEADRLAKQVWLSSEAEGHFTDNFFDLLPGSPVTVAFRKRSDGGEPFAAGDPGSMQVRSMYDFIKSSAGAQEADRQAEEQAL
ncbi:glycoside hydrolase family 2 sugar binding protein [Paenibacillus mucilaginosus 3016]|uniref:Beta-mannosidase B n=1 Tax=Paenibacillus mucilaginosus 3016 TaxID=1116391 RepID=H6NFB7_9BACL|nr:glycoside hydrolase family 2 protein [Paenibacillus mucilaginosus]AFC29526.1 glycoside hydrolase family 2 sugar binding protein [Paenibacillus mucilaginosus 3016]WFA18225.1 glycoside hydrolase family 2 protein [Paenibacillus mucilaginosus]